MKKNVLFFFLGIGMGILIFWSPTIIALGHSFAAPLFFELMIVAMPWLFGSWLFPALPYVFFFWLVFGICSIFAFWKKKNSLAWVARNLFWFSLGLYLALSLFFFLLTAAANPTIL
jgi:hypothetical protein